MPGLRTGLRIGRRLTAEPTDVLCAVVALALIAHVALPRLWSTPVVATWTTIFVAICVQATPYVVLGVGVSAAIQLVPAGWVQRALPRRAALAVPVAGIAGIALPGCECGSVPVAAALLRRGVSTGPATALLLSAPAVNPVVLAATAVAFPRDPGVVVARFAASLLVAVIVGWICATRFGDAAQPAPARPDHAHGKAGAVIDAAADLARSIGLLTVGAASAASFTTLVPAAWVAHVTRSPAAGIALAALLAVVLAVCSSADAFVASSFTQFSRTAQLTFLVVGPAVDLKTVAMQAGALGTRFAMRLAALALCTAVAVAAVVGAVVW